jgi:TRAP-type C4-dicarboxylate transport system substrate-binding protein
MLRKVFAFFLIISMFQSDVGKEFLDLLSDQNAVGIAWYAAMPRNFYNSRKAVHSPADLKGLKIRVQEADIMIDLVRALGALPQPLPYSEVYTAIQTGVIDGAENDWSSYVLESHNEVAKQISDDAHTIVPEILFISKKLLDSLSEADRKIVLDAAAEAAKFQWDIIRKTESEFRAKAEKLGSTITHIEDKGLFRKAVEPLYAKYGEGYADVITKIQGMK